MTSFVGLVRVLFLCLAVSAVGAKSCKKPKVRREWRKLEPRQRANWIDAVNVTTLSLDLHSPSPQDADRYFSVSRQTPSRPKAGAGHCAQHLAYPAR